MFTNQKNVIFYLSLAHVRVHSLDKRCCRLHIRLDTKAKEIKKEACNKLSLDPDEHILCEGKSCGDVTLFDEEDLSITTEMSVNGRLYVFPKNARRHIVSFDSRYFIVNVLLYFDANFELLFSWQRVER